MAFEFPLKSFMCNFKSLFVSFFYPFKSFEVIIDGTKHSNFIYSNLIWIVAIHAQAPNLEHEGKKYSNIDALIQYEIEQF